VSTDDDRPTDPGGYPGIYAPGGPGYAGTHRTQEPEDSGLGVYDDGGFDNRGYDNSSTTVLSRPDSGGDGDQPVRRGYTWHGGADVGLLVLRVVVGGTFVAHSLQKLFGLWGGQGIDGFATYLGTYGFTQTTLLSWITGVGELIGGALLVLGLFTPIGAAAVLAVAANVIYLKWNAGFFDPPVGYEREALLAAGAFTLLFTGPGRVALDRPTPWGRRPVPLGLFMLLVAAGLCVVSLIVLR
jgi:putative oxidoreductase